MAASAMPENTLSQPLLVSPSTPSDLWKSIYDNFIPQFEQLQHRGIITSAQFKTIKGAQGAQDLLDAILQHQGVTPEQRTSSVPRVVENSTVWSLEKFRTFGTAIDTLAQANFISCLFWGGLKAALMVINDIRDSKSDLIQQFHEIVHIVNLVGEYRKLLEDIHGFRDKIEPPMKEFYEGVLVWTLHCFSCLPRARGGFPRQLLNGLKKSQPLAKIAGANFARIRRAKHKILDIVEQEKFRQFKATFVPLAFPRTDQNASTDENGPRLWNVSNSPPFPLCNRFLGRDDTMSELCQLMHKSGRAAIWGWTGMGKSQLAFQYLSTSAQKYQLKYWIDCSSLASLENSVKNMMARMSFHAREQTTALAVEILCDALEQTEHPWLLVLDDCCAATIARVWKVLPSRNGHVIFTTKDLQVAQHLVLHVPERCIKLGPISHADSLQLLLSSLSQDAEANPEEIQAAEMINSVYTLGWPYAISIIASHAKHHVGPNRLSLILRLLESSEYRDTVLTNELTEVSVRKTLEASLLDLPLPVRALLSVLACLDAVSFPKRLLLPQVPLDSRLIPIPLADGSSHTVQMSSFSDQLELELHIAELSRRGFIFQRTGADGETNYWMHRLLISTVQSTQLNIDQGMEALKTALDICKTFFPNDEGSPDIWRNAAHSFQQFDACISFAAKHRFHENATKTIILKRGYLLYHWKGDLQSAEEIIVSLLRGPRISLHQRSNTDLELLALLGLIRSYVNGNSQRARAYYRLHKLILSECLKRFKPPNDIIVSLMNRIGDSAMRYDCNESQVLLGRAYRHKLSSSLFGRNHPSTLATYCSLVNLSIKQGYFDKARKMICKLEARLRNTDKSTWTTIYWGNLFYNMSFTYKLLGFYKEENEFALLTLQADRKGLETSHRFLTLSAGRYIESLQNSLLPGDISSAVAGFLKDERCRLELNVLHEQYWEVFLKISAMQISTLIFSCATISSAITAFDNIVGLYRENKIDPWQLWSKEMSDAYCDGDLRLGLHKAIKVHSNVTKIFGTYSQWFQPPELMQNDLMTILLETLLLGIDSEGEEQNWWMLTALSSDTLQTSYVALRNKYVTIWHGAWSEIERRALAYDINCYIQPEHLYVMGTEDEELELTALMSVTLSGSVPAVDLVMSKQPSVDVENSSGDTALFYAARGHHFDIFITLLKGHGRDQARPKMVFSQTSLLHLISRKTWQSHAEAKDRQQHAAIELLDRCTEADLEMKDGDGKTPLDIARSDKVVGLVKIFGDFIAKRKQF